MDDAKSFKTGFERVVVQKFCERLLSFSFINTLKGACHIFKFSFSVVTLQAFWMAYSNWLFAFWLSYRCHWADFCFLFCFLSTLRAKENNQKKTETRIDLSWSILKTVWRGNVAKESTFSKKHDALLVNNNFFMENHFCS